MNPTTIPLPLALQYLIKANNQLLQEYQSKLQSEVNIANQEIMQMLGLSPNEWKIDVPTYTYVKLDSADAPPVK